MKLKLKDKEYFSNKSQTFKTIEGFVVEFEHSLYTIAKWESLTNKPFFSIRERDEKTNDDMTLYIKCMIINDVDLDLAMFLLSDSDLEEIYKYIKSSQTATWFASSNKVSRSSEIITSEVLYFYMFEKHIDISCERWHINRLLTLLRVFVVKQNPEKMSKETLAAQNRALNKSRRAKLKSKG